MKWEQKTFDSTYFPSTVLGKPKKLDFGVRMGSGISKVVWPYDTNIASLTLSFILVISKFKNQDNVDSPAKNAKRKKNRCNLDPRVQPILIYRFTYNYNNYIKIITYIQYYCFYTTSHHIKYCWPHIDYCWPHINYCSLHINDCSPHIDCCFSIQLGSLWKFFLVDHCKNNYNYKKIITYSTYDSRVVPHHSTR